MEQDPKDMTAAELVVATASALGTLRAMVPVDDESPAVFDRFNGLMVELAARTLAAPRPPLANIG